MANFLEKFENFWVRLFLSLNTVKSPKNKMAISPPTLNPRIFGTVKDTENIYYLTKNQVRGLHVGGDMAILFLAILQCSGKNDRTPIFQ